MLRLRDTGAAHSRAGLEEGRNAQKALEESKARIAGEFTEKSGEGRQLVSDARTEAEKAKGEVLTTAHSEAEQLHKQVREKVKAEEAAAVSSVESNMPELVAILSNKLLHSDEMDKGAALIKDCIEASK